MKKILAMVLALALILSSVSALALEEVDAEAVAAQIKIQPNALLDKSYSITPATDVKLYPSYSSIPVSMAKYSAVAKPQLTCGVSSSTTDDELKMWKQMGINACELSIADNELTYEALYPIVERLRNFPEGGFEILIASNYTFQKDRIIHLQLEGWEAEIERFNDYLRLLSSVGIYTCAIAWQPNGISRSGDTPKSIHGANAGASSMQGLADVDGFYGLKNDRMYTQEEMWQTFSDFLERVLPVCKETGVHMALHPNDPPVPYLGGVGSLIISSADYDRAFAMDPDGYLGMKLPIGCMTEGGLLFTTDMIGDITRWVSEGRVLNVHFRNVSAPLDEDYSGYFEETLAEDGYADMYEIMLALIRAGYNGSIFCDHAHKSVNSELLGAKTNRATSDAWIKGLIYAARAQVTKEIGSAQK